MHASPSRAQAVRLVGGMGGRYRAAGGEGGPGGGGHRDTGTQRATRGEMRGRDRWRKTDLAAREMAVVEMIGGSGWLGQSEGPARGESRGIFTFQL
jgi:hypothetical protein